MTIYARIFAGAVDRLVVLTPEQFAALQVNGKAAQLRLWVVDALPTPTASQVVVTGPVTVTTTEARQTWLLRDKTQVELDADANAAELPQLVSWIDQWTTDIQAYTPNIDTSGTQAVQAANMWTHIKDLQRQMVRNNKALRFLARERRT